MRELITVSPLTRYRVLMSFIHSITTIYTMSESLVTEWIQRSRALRERLIIGKRGFYPVKYLNQLMIRYKSIM